MFITFCVYCDNCHTEFEHDPSPPFKIILKLNIYCHNLNELKQINVNLHLKSVFFLFIKVHPIITNQAASTRYLAGLLYSGSCRRLSSRGALVSPGRGPLGGRLIPPCSPVIWSPAPSTRPPSVQVGGALVVLYLYYIF